jgi:lysophospholipase L1-like esterase
MPALPGVRFSEEDFIMKRILCYGDSNTWGYDPITKDRFDDYTRWTRVLGNTLDAAYEIIEEGLSGRTTVWDDPIEGYKNGKKYLIPCLETHHPLDLVILMLGTNDLKKRFSLSAYDIAEGAKVLVGIVQNSKAGANGQAPQVLLLAPPPTTTLTDYAEMFEGAEDKSQKFSSFYARIAAALECDFLDTATVIVSSPLDGIHFEAGEHYKLGRTVAGKVKELEEKFKKSL